MLRRRTGSTTIFICIVLSVLIPFSCILLDVTRYTLAVKQAETALKTCAESMLAAYDRQLREQYGLFAMYPRDPKVMEEEIYELLSENLNTGANADGTADLYGFKVKKVQVIPFYNYSEPYVLQQQVAEFMKYRAPVQVVQEFYEKIKLMMGLMKEGDMIEQKMTLDKLMNDIRSSLVNMYFLLKLEIPKFNKDDTGESVSGSRLPLIKGNTQKTPEELKIANSYADRIKEYQQKYIDAYKKKIQAEKDVKYYQDMVDELEREIDRKSEAKADEQADGSGSSNNDDSDLSDLRERHSRASDLLRSANRHLNDLISELSEYKKELDYMLPKVISSLERARQLNKTSSAELNVLLNHLKKHEQFHIDLLAIIDQVTPQLVELENQSSSLLSEANDTGGSASDRIQGDLQKQLKCIKRETFTEIRSDLDKNLTLLQKWRRAAESCLPVIDGGLNEIIKAKVSAEAVYYEPQNEKNQYLGYNGYGNVESAVSALDSGLSDLKPLDQMKNNYATPVYELEPAPNEEEKNAYLRWFYERYHGFEPEKPPGKDDKELNDIRDGATEFARGIGKQGEESGSQKEGTDTQDASSGESDDEDDYSSGLLRFESLPSREGATSSNQAIRRIGREIKESNENRTVVDSPFDKPVEGLENVNENEKSFFDYELSRIKELLNIIKNAVANGLEGMIEGLYVNEYIVSAFKCAATGDSIEHDIGWDRPLDSTYFDKAEVEYIIFGNMSEQKNIGCSKRSIFAIRLPFNLLHVYTDADKLAATLSMATTIAGWTIFGIPVVQNFLLITWAGLESYVDTELLVKGENVPLIKTSSSWNLEWGKLADYLKNIFLKDIKEFVKEKIDSGVDKASEAIVETITGIINSKIDKAFAPFEEGAVSFVGDVGSSVADEVSAIFDQGFLSGLESTNLERFAESLEAIVKRYIENIAGKLQSMTQDKLAEFKCAVKAKIRTLIFESDIMYKSLVEKVKKVGNDLLDKGISAVEGQIDKAFGAGGKSGGSNIAGRLILMDYVDYLRLMLLAVPAETKELRTADLMELNMQEVSEDYSLSIDNYKTFVFIKVELDMNTWFLPEKLFRKGNSGMITIEWSQGY